MAPFKQKRQLAHEHDPNYVFGRPSKYKPEYCQQVIDTMSEGYSLTAFAGSITVAAETVYAWMERYADFSDAVARARARRVMWWEHKLKTSRKGAETSAAMFALKNANPLEWRDMRTLQHEHNLSVETLTLEQLEAIASGAHPGDHTILNATFTRLPAPDLGTDLGTEPEIEQDKPDTSDN
jgi:hypothetical protein